MTEANTAPTFAKTNTDSSRANRASTVGLYRKKITLKVLIIDDHPAIRLLFKEALEAEGYQTIEASGGQQGIDSYSRENPDIVITDIDMPEIDGHEVIREIRKADADAKIIAVTGAGLYHLPVAHELGADRVFEKPLRPAELIATIKELVS